MMSAIHRQVAEPQTDRPLVTVPFMTNRLDWRRAAAFSLMPLPEQGPGPLTRVTLLADERALYVRFSCQGSRLHAHRQNDGDPLYLEDVVKVFLRPTQSDPAIYLGYEVSPLGRDLTLLCCQHQDKRSAWRPYGHMPDERPTCSVTVSSGQHQPLTAVRSWQAEICIPFLSLAGFSRLPKLGDIWMANFHRVDHASGAAKHYAWSPPPSVDFHHLPTFGALRFGACL